MHFLSSLNVGVYESNVNNLLKKIKNLHQITLMTKDELCEIIGPSNGAQLFNFFHLKYSSP